MKHLLSISWQLTDLAEARTPQKTVQILSTLRPSPGRAAQTASVSPSALISLVGDQRGDDT